MADLDLSRRTVVGGAAATAGLAAATGALGKPTGEAPARMPVLFVPHGGGPWPWVDGMRRGHATLEPFLKALPGTVPRPKAILSVTAHWEAARPTVSTNPTPPMLYDYYGFPEHTYAVSWPAPGAPDLAARVRGLLDGAGIATDEDAERGFDHGTFVPLAVAWPEADIPTVQLSLVKGLDPAQHLAIGRALAPLRDEGVLIVGSGMSYHNMRGFGRPEAAGDALAFDGWLGDAVADPETRAASLEAWTSAPSARAVHPREEHLLPLMVVTGAAGDDAASLPYQGDVLGMRVSAVRYG